MNIILVDDEILALEDLENAVHEALPEAKLHCFSKARDALDFVAGNKIDIAFLDINMRGFDGLTLAGKIQERWHSANIIFCTGYGEYAGDAMKLHASGYLMKPISAADVRKELSYLRFAVDDIVYLITVENSGEMKVYDKDGNPLKFKRKLTKDLFLALFNCGGKSTGVNELCEKLWDDNKSAYLYEKNKKYLMQLLVDLRKVLENCGAGKVLQRSVNGYYLDMSFIRIK